MKILFPTTIFYPSMAGGPANSVYYLAKELVKTGTEVYVITTMIGIKNKKDIVTNKWIELDGIKVFYLKSKNEDYFNNKVFSNILSIEFLNIKIPKVDIIHLSSFFDPFNLYFLFIANIRKIPFIISPHGEFSIEALKIKSFKKKLYLKIPIIKYILNKAIFHVTALQEMEATLDVLEEYLDSTLEKKIYTIPNIIDYDLLKAKSEFANSVCNSKYILFLGRISRIKNIEMLIDTFSVLDIKEDVKLVIAGDIKDDYKYYQELREKIFELNLVSKVIFTKKRIEGLEKNALYHDAELFILPSKSENFGMVVLESLSQKTPVVTTKGTPWESLNQNCGYWVNMNIASLKAAIEDYFSLNNKKKFEMQNNAKLLSKSFSAKKLISRYKKMYNEILNYNLTLF